MCPYLGAALHQTSDDLPEVQVALLGQAAQGEAMSKKTKKGANNMQRSGRKHDPRDGWYTLTPADATRLLDEQPMNRPIRQSKVEKFSAVIAAGDWVANGETIILDENDCILDGQGRCRSVQIAGRAIETYVIHGVSRKAFTSIDTGQGRSAGDTLALSGAQNVALLAAVCRWCIVLDVMGYAGSSSQPKYSITNTQVNEFYRKNKAALISALSDLSDIAANWVSACKGIVPPSMLVYVYLRGKSLNAAKAKEFAVGVITGESLAKGSPMLALRKYDKMGQRSQHVDLAMAIKAMNAHLEGRQLLLLKWDPKRETFPVVNTTDDDLEYRDPVEASLHRAQLARG